MNTPLSGSGRIDNIQRHPQGELRGLSKFVKVTEDVRKFAAEQKLSEEKALKAGIEKKACELVGNGGEICAKT
jgi:hypothetical protein